MALCTCSEGALRGGWYNGLLVIDATGFVFRVDTARLKRVGKKAWPSLFAPRLIEVELTIGRVEQLTTEQVRELISREINSRRESFGSVYGLDLDGLLKEIESAESISEIWDIISSKRMGLLVG